MLPGDDGLVLLQALRGNAATLVLHECAQKVELLACEVDFPAIRHHGAGGRRQLDRADGPMRCIKRVWKCVRSTMATVLLSGARSSRPMLQRLGSDGSRAAAARLLAR